MAKRIVIKVLIGVAVVLLALGAVMFGGGLSLLGISLPGSDNTTPEYAQIEGNVQTVSIDVQPRKYTPIVVQKGIAVRFILNAEASNLNECNSTIIIPGYNIKKTLEPGENIIEFMPDVAGKVPYSCSMSMIKSYIKIVANEH